MAGIDLSSLSGLTKNLGDLMPSGQDLIQNLMLGAGVSVVTKGIQAGGLSSLDPLGLFPHPANNPNAVTGPTISASAFSMLNAQGQASFLAAGGHIIAG